MSDNSDSQIQQLKIFSKSHVTAPNDNRFFYVRSEQPFFLSLQTKAKRNISFLTIHSLE